MRNVEMKIVNSHLIIDVDLAKEGVASSSGKSLVIGSTEGNVSVPDMPDIKVGLNVYKKK